MGVDLLLRLTADEYAPHRARREIRGSFTGDVSPERRTDIALIASELVSNSVQHAHLLGEDEIRVDIDCTEERIRIEVEDDGLGLPADDGAQMSQWGGRGLRIVARLSSRWGFYGAFPATVWAELDRPGRKAQKPRGRRGGTGQEDAASGRSRG